MWFPPFPAFLPEHVSRLWVLLSTLIWDKTSTGWLALSTSTYRLLPIAVVYVCSYSLSLLPNEKISIWRSILPFTLNMSRVKLLVVSIKCKKEQGKSIRTTCISPQETHLIYLTNQRTIYPVLRSKILQHPTDTAAFLPFLLSAKLVGHYHKCSGRCLLSPGSSHQDSAISIYLVLFQHLPV